MTENWIIDASPLILLGKAGQLGWLLQMGRIFVQERECAGIGTIHACRSKLSKNWPTRRPDANLEP